MRPNFPTFTATLIAAAVGLPLFAFGQSTPAAPSPSPATMVERAVERLTGPPTAERLRDLRQRASAIIGSHVYDEHGVSIGKVDDLVLANATSSAVVVISVGGFLGIGDRLVTLPLSELRFGGPEGHWTLAGATQASLTARPAFHYDTRL